MSEVKEKRPLNEEQQTQLPNHTPLTLADAIRVACYSHGIKDHDVVECIVGGVFARYCPGGEVFSGSTDMLVPAFIRLKLAGLVETTARVKIADISYYRGHVTEYFYPRANSKLVLASGAHLYCEETPEDIDRALNLCGVPIHDVKRFTEV